MGAAKREQALGSQAWSLSAPTGQTCKETIAQSRKQLSYDLSHH